MPSLAVQRRGGRLTPANEETLEGGLIGAAFSGAKEAALDAFLAGRLRFTGMSEVVERTLFAPGGEAGPPCRGGDPGASGVEEVLEADRRGRSRAAQAAGRLAH